MAYRLPTDRRDRTNEGPTLSYLEHFLEQIENLPSTTKSTFADIRAWDDQIEEHAEKARLLGEKVMGLAASKSNLDVVRRNYHEFIHAQDDAKEIADNKLRSATAVHKATDDVIADLDRRLVEFEAQLKRDGRWPGANPPLTTQPNTPDQPKAARSPSAKAPRAEFINGASASHAPSTRAAQKARNREAAPSQPLVTPRSRNTPTATRASNAAATAAHVSPEPASREGEHGRGGEPETVKGSEGKIAKTEAEAVPASQRLADAQESEKDAPEEAAPNTQPSDATSNREANDGVSVDDTLYCSCRRVSHGDMIACEGKNCPFEWYHFECVGLKEAPAGMWFCPACREKERKRKSGTARRKYG